MLYSVSLSNEAEGFLKKLDKSEQIRIRNKLRDLKENPKLGKPMKFDLAGKWSLRIGKYRAIYEIFEGKLLIYVIEIGHRKNIYG